MRSNLISHVQYFALLAVLAMASIGAGVPEAAERPLVLSRLILIYASANLRDASAPVEVLDSIPSPRER